MTDHEQISWEFAVMEAEEENERVFVPAAAIIALNEEYDTLKAQLRTSTGDHSIGLIVFFVLGFLTGLCLIPLFWPGGR